MNGREDPLAEERFDELLDRVAAGELTADDAEIAALRDVVERPAERLDAALRVRTQLERLAREADEDLERAESERDPRDRERVQVALTGMPAHARPRRSWIGLLVAAGWFALLLGFGWWSFVRDSRPSAVSDEPGLLGGSAVQLTLERDPTGRRLLRWEALPGADRYRIQLVADEDGPALLRQTTRATSWVVPESLPEPRWLLFEALDAFGATLEVERIELRE